MEIQTLKSNLLNLIEETTEDEIGLKSFVQKYLDKKDLTSYFELKHVVNMLQMTTVNKQLSLIINTIKWSLPSGEAINSLCSNLVSSSKNLSPELHCEALKEFENCLCIDNPQYVKLPGNRDSCLQVQTTNVGMTGVRSFTASIWIKVESDCSPMGFLLFHCAGKKNSIQVHFADRQADGSWKVILRAERQSAASSSSTAAHAVEVDGRINFALGEWHHFVLKHDESNRIAFLVDGALEVTRDLPYQFTHASEYRWIFGQGLKGGLATICFYSEALSLPVLQLLYSLGPHTKSVATGVVSVPQSSFDSGHTILGTKISKGVSAHKMCRLPVMFNITASHLIEGANLPQFPLGRLNVDYTEMSPRSSAVTNFLSPNITGGCRVTLPNSWVDAWLDAGGCAVILYLINHYCSLANTEVETDGVETKSSESMGCVKRGLSLLTQLVRQSAEAKEQFIQTHGFHLLSHSLAQLTHKGFQLDLDMINLCCDLLPALGADARNGDGVAAALQGLLFDFRVWGEASLEVRMHHMFRLVDLTSERGEELEKSIGVQRILDILRLHVLRQDYSLGRQADFEGIQVACAEAGYSLLTIATDSGLALLNRNISNVNYVITDIEALLAGVEETNSCLLTERILRVLLKFRDMAPTVFNDVIGRHRYAETTAVSLLSRKGYSAEIHRETIALVLWSLVRECQLDAAMVLQLRRTLVCPILPIEEVIMAGKRRVKRVKMLPPAEAKRIADGVETIKNAMRAAHRAWNSMSMLAILIARAISEGFWNSSLAFSNTTFVVGKSVMDSEDRVPVALTPEEETYRKKIIQEVLSVFHNNGPFGGRPDFWMVLPLLPPLLSHCDLSIYQQILMSFVVSLKTDEAQVETICNLPDRGWTKILIDLAVIGEHYSFRVSSKLTGALGRVEDIGTEEKLSHQEGIAVTCTELALDAAATMLEHKIRFHDQDAWSCWSCLQNCIKTSSAAFRSRGAAIEKQLVKRCLALIFQRLARSNDPWNAGMLNFLENVLMLIANKGLCGQEQIPYTAPDHGSPFPPNATDTTVPAGSSLDDTSPSSKMIDSQNPQRLSLQDRTLSLRPLSAQPVPQSREEQQLLLFVIDLVACLRRVATKHTMFGRELAVLRISLNIALGCLRVANEISAEKLSCEIMNNVAYLSRPTSISMGTEEYKQYIVQIFTRIESVCKDQALDGVIRGRYHALIYRLCHFFGDLRHSAVKSEDGEEPVPSYVLPTLDALSGIENQHDVEVIFEIFRVSLIFSDTVAFDSLDVSDSEMAQIGASPSGVVSSSDEAINKSTHDTADLLSLDEHTETLPAAQFPIAGTSTSCDSPLPEDSQHSHSSNPSVDSNRDREWVSPSALSLMTSVKDPQYPTWVRIRGGIVTDRVDSERLRLSQCMQSLDMNTAAVEKHWSKLQRKVESESFLLSHPCQWKLGVAHEVLIFLISSIILSLILFNLL